MQRRNGKCVWHQSHIQFEAFFLMLQRQKTKEFKQLTLFYSRLYKRQIMSRRNEYCELKELLRDFNRVVFVVKECFSGWGFKRIFQALGY